MLEAAPFVIPTASRGKISHVLSFPIGAEQISKALVGVPQLLSIQLRFHAPMGGGTSLAGELLRVEYLNEVQAEVKWPIHTIYPRPPQHRWEIIVHPVLRSRRFEVKDYLIKHALPDVAQWLFQRGDQAAKGSEILAFFFDKESPSGFAAHRLSKLEPFRRMK